MNKFKLVSCEMILVCGGIFLLGNSVRSQGLSEYLDVFPGLCSKASIQEPLVGHIVRLGEVAETQDGLVFLFPDQRATGLQMMSMADNAGIIGQDPDEDPSDMIDRTPLGSFVVAQVFVGDPNSDPVITCVSEPILLDHYVSGDYGADFRWLTLGSFRTYLVPTAGIVPRSRYSRWNWRRYWAGDFLSIRHRFKERGFRDYRNFRSLKRKGEERLGKGRPTGTKTLKEGRRMATTGLRQEPTTEGKPATRPEISTPEGGTQGTKRAVTYIGGKAGGGFKNLSSREPSSHTGTGGGLKAIPSRAPSRQIGGDVKYPWPPHTQLPAGRFKNVQKRRPSSKLNVGTKETRKGSDDVKSTPTQKVELGREEK